MRARSRGAVSLLPITGAMALLVFCVAGARLYVSSAGSAAFADGVASTCATDSALALPAPSGSDDAMSQIAKALRFVQPPIRRTTGVARLTTDYGTRRITVLDIDGVAQHVTPPLAPLGEGEIAISATSMRELAVSIGDTLQTSNGVPLTVTQVFDDVPYSPLPDYWCGWGFLFEPNATGDPPAPSAIASKATLAQFGGIDSLEYRLVREPLTLTEADEAVHGYSLAEDAWSARFAQDYGTLAANELPRLAARAHAVATTVDRSVTPVVLTAVVAVALVLCAMAVLLARARVRELRLLAIRGVPPLRIAVTVVPEVALALMVGTIGGWAISYVAVRSLGPSSLLEGAAIAGSIARSMIALVVGIPVVCGVVAFVADHYTDQLHRRHHARWVMALVAVAPAALAAVSLRRLDEEGGIRTSGVESRGGGLLPMGFPLFALVAVAGLIAVVLALIVPRLRLTGRRLHRSVRLGWRRAVLDTGPAVSVVVAVALAAGCYTTSRSLADTAMRELRDKADVYVGADLAMTVYDDPAGSAATVIDRWHGATTLVRTGHWRADDASYDLLGVDPATFAAVAATRDRDAAATLRREVRLLQPVPDDEPVPAVVVGRDSDIGAVAVGDVVDVAVVGGRAPISVRIVAKARYFPTSANGAVMYVVDHSVVDRFVQFPVDVLLARDPPPDAPRQLRDAGVRIGKVLDAASVFDGAAYSGLRWSYAPLGVLGVLFGIVALTVQLLVAAGRSASRRATHVVMRRTGFGRRSLVTASAVELGVPLAIGTILGALAAVTASSLAVGRLDPMALLQPPVRYAVPWASLAAVAVAVALWTVAVAFAIARSTVRADPAGVLHGDL